MKATELRIGNLIKHSDFKCLKEEFRNEVILVTVEILRYLSHVEEDHLYAPISLTEAVERKDYLLKK